MRIHVHYSRFVMAILAVLTLFVTSAVADQAEELAKQLANPVAALISVPSSV